VPVGVGLDHGEEAGPVGKEPVEQGGIMAEMVRRDLAPGEDVQIKRLRA